MNFAVTDLSAAGGGDLGVCGRCAAYVRPDYVPAYCDLVQRRKSVYMRLKSDRVPGMTRIILPAFLIICW